MPTILFSRSVRLGRAWVALTVAVLLMGCNQLLGIHELGGQESDGGFDASVGGSTMRDASDASDARTDAVPAGDGGTSCQQGQLRCTATGVPQKCNANGTAFENQDPCPTNLPLCDEKTGTCSPGCMAGDRRCSPSASVIQQCDLQGLWRDATTCDLACTGSGETTACSGTCKPGTRSCDSNNTPLLCDSTGTNQPQTACAGLCSNGMCTGSCKPGLTRCSSASPNMVETCDSTGNWGAAQACRYVCDATTGQCGGDCSPGSPNQCSSNIVQACDASGHFTTVTTCTGIPCSGGQCRACTANEKQCNAGKPQTCSAGGAWVDDQASACQFLCDTTTGKCAGECIPGTDLCVGQTTKHCGNTGTYGAATACGNICDATTGRCGGVCVPNTHRCNGQSSQTCGADGQWGADSACPFGCSTTTGQCNACTDEPMATTCGGGKCGATPNNCNHMVTCSSTCSGTGQPCGGGGVTGVCGCSPNTAAQTCQNGALCGNVVNNCGLTVTCATNCVAPQTCGGGGTANACGCTPKTASAVCGSRNCGTVADGCGGMASCGPLAGGACPSGMVCSNGTCASTCTPITACPTGKNCSTIDNGCNTGTVTCGTMSGNCPSGQTCGGGSPGVANVCGCTPLTKAQACVGGQNCNTASNGCGTTLSCGTCVSPQTCGGGGTANVCGCTESNAAFCARLGKTCGTVSGTDLCGVSRSTNCGTCATGCCGTTNTCVTTEAPTACGATGQACTTCPAPNANSTATCSAAGVCGSTCKPGFLGTQCQTPMFQPIAFSVGAPGIFAVRAANISSDGLVVIGYADFDGGSLNHPFRFTQVGGIEDLTARSGLVHYFSGINSTGTIVAGSNDSGLFRWSLTSATTTPALVTTPTFPGAATACGSFSAPKLSHDAGGSVVVGTCDFPDPLFLTVTMAVRWTGTSFAPDVLAAPSGIQVSSVVDVSSDGSAMAGYYILDNVIHGVRWRVVGLTTLFDELGGDPSLNATPAGISGDGQVLFGSGFSSATSSSVPFRWTGSTGIQMLALPAGRPNGFPQEASQDGSVIVGWTGGSSEATVWDATGVHLLRDMLVAAGLPSTQLSGWSLGVASSVSSDGKVIAGYGINPSGQSEPWVARLP